MLLLFLHQPTKSAAYASNSKPKRSLPVRAGLAMPKAGFLESDPRRFLPALGNVTPFARAEPSLHCGTTLG